MLGDIILQVNSKKINSASDLYRILDRCSVGDKVRAAAAAVPLLYWGGRG